MKKLFDPSQDMYATREIQAGGVTFYRGDLFDKSLVTTKKLELMFDYHHIGYEWHLDGAVANKQPLKPAQLPAELIGEKAVVKKQKGKAGRPAGSKNKKNDSKKISKTKTLSSISPTIEDIGISAEKPSGVDNDLAELLNMPKEAVRTE